MRSLVKKRPASGALAAAPAAFVFIGSAIAAEPVDEIIVTGLRPTPIDQVATSVTVLGPDDLDIRNAPYLADQLRAAPGLAVSRAGARGGLTQVRIRGAEANHTLFLVDGFEVSDPVTGETDFGLWAGGDLASVEILRGEQSSLYGSDAIGGVVNVRTRRDAGASLSAEGGSFGTGRVEGRFGLDGAAGALALSGFGFTTEGVDTSGSDGEKDGSQSFAGAASGELDLGGSWALSGLLRYSYNDVETDADVDFDGRLDDTDRETESRQWTAGAALSGDAFGINHVIRGSYGRVAREDFADGAFGSETIGERVRARYSPSVGWVGEGYDVTVTGLVEYEREDYERIAVDTFFGDPNQAQSFETFGVAGEARARIGRLSAVGSVRRDDNDGLFENAVSWRVGAAYQLFDATRVRASAGEGVKNPTFTELFGFFPGQFVGDPDLQPERSFSFEVGVDQRLGPVDLSVTYFNAQLEDEIFTIFNPDFTSSPANRDGDSEREGVEVGARAQLTGAFSVSGAFTHLNSSNDADADEIRVPNNTASLALDWRSPEKDAFRIGLAADYVGPQDDFFFTFPAERVRLDDYVLVSATAVYPVSDRLALTLRGENLADQRITDVFGFNQTGIGVFAGIRLR